MQLPIYHYKTYESYLDFDVIGLKDGNWEAFIERRDYEAFFLPCGCSQNSP